MIFNTDHTCTNAHTHAHTNAATSTVAFCANNSSPPKPNEKTHHVRVYTLYNTHCTMRYSFQFNNWFIGIRYFFSCVCGDLSNLCSHCCCTFCYSAFFLVWSFFSVHFLIGLTSQGFYRILLIPMFVVRRWKTVAYIHIVCVHFKTYIAHRLNIQESDQLWLL